MDFSNEKNIPLPLAGGVRGGYRNRAIAYIILAATLAIYVLQLRSLETVPVADSVRWGGDETWLMREFGNQARHGVMSYPENFGGPPNGIQEERTDGLLAGSMWMNVLIYGVPGNVLSPMYDLVSIGRAVTALLGFLLMASIFFLLRRLGVQPIIAACAVTLLTISQGFVWATHCARYDLLTGLVLLWYVYVLAKQSGRDIGRRQALYLGAVGIGLIIFSRHLLTLPFGATVAFFIVTRIWKNKSALIGYSTGAGIAIAILAFVYWLGAGELSLFGRGGSLGSFAFVLRQIPIARPFSRNVQFSNILERYNLFASDAPGVLILLIAALVLILSYKIWQWSLRRQGKQLRIARTPQQYFILLAAPLCFFDWLLFQGSRTYYLFHIVPLLIVAGSVILELFAEVQAARWYGRTIPILLLVIGIVWQADRAIPAISLGKAISRDQSAAIARLLRDAPLRSRVLVDVAGLDRALQDTSHEILTLDMFQPPANADDAVQKLRANRIDFVILRSSPVGDAFEPGRALLPHILDSIGEARDTALGFFYDDGRNYDASLDLLIEQGLDTLKLYSTRWR